ncbi:MAG: TRAP transporter fused permease subunit, partial [Chloroflexota bacterium]
TLIRTLAIVANMFFILYLAGAFAYFNIFLMPIAYNALFLAVVLTLTFLLTPARKGTPRPRLPWYDLLLILGSLASCAYIFVNALELSFFGKITATPLEIALGAIILVALAEAVRRSFGWAMLVVTIAFLAYAKFGYLISGPFHVHYSNWSVLTADIYLSRASLFGGLTSLASTIIIAFITFGVFFIIAGGGEFFLNIALALGGRMRGGPAKAAIIGSALFGTISGSGAANVVVTGSITIPLMKRTGYKAYYAGAIEAIASTGGQITPPIMGATAFIMADLLAVPYSTIALMAALPAVLYFLSLYVQVDLHAAKHGLKGLPREQLPSLKENLKGGWELALPFVVLVFFLFVIRYTAVTSAIYTIVALVIISQFRKAHRINLKRFLNGFEGGLRASLDVTTIIALAAVIMTVLTVTGLGPKLSSGLVTIFGGNAILLITAAGIACYILGMGVSLTASYVLVSVLVAPALVKLGIPLLVTHFFILYIVTSTMFTPPYCPASFVAAGIAKAHPFRIGFQAMRLGIVCFLVPVIIVFNPALLLIGKPFEVVIASLTAIVGIFGLSAGIEGYLFSNMNWGQRLLFFIGGGVMVVPGLITDAAGLGILALAILWQRTSSRKLTASGPPPAEGQPLNAAG